MWAMRPADKQELDAYRTLGTVDELKLKLMRLDFNDWAKEQLKHPAFGPYPTNDDLAPLPLSDPTDPTGPYADECWDDRTHSGLLEDDY